MPIVSKVWGQGQLSDSFAAIATMSSEAGVRVGVWFYNTHSSAVTIEVQINADGNDRNFAKFTLNETDWSAMLELPPLMDGDIVKAQCSVDAVCNYVVSGGSST